MDTRVAVISIIVSDNSKIEELNALLHKASAYIVMRTGIPYRERCISIICVAIDAPQDIISALAGGIGRIKGITSRTVYSNVITHQEGET